MKKIVIYLCFTLYAHSLVHAQQATSFTKRLTNNNSSNLCRSIVQDQDGNYILLKSTENPHIGYLNTSLLKIDSLGNTSDSLTINGAMYIEKYGNNFLYFDNTFDSTVNYFYVRVFDKNLNIIEDKIIDTLGINEGAFRHLTNAEGHHIFLVRKFVLPTPYKTSISIIETDQSFNFVKKFTYDSCLNSMFIYINEVTSDSSYIITTSNIVYKCDKALTHLDSIAFIGTSIPPVPHIISWYTQPRRFNDSVYFGISYTGNSGSPDFYEYPGIILLTKNAESLDKISFPIFSEDNNLWYDGQQVDFITPDTLFFTSKAYSDQQNDGILVAKFDLNHQIFWQHFYGFDCYYNNATLSATADGGCILALEAWNWTIDTESFQQDIFLMKIDKDGNASANLNENTSENKLILVYPNPASENIFINTGLFQNLKVELYNSEGQCVYTSWLNSGTSNIDISKLSTGIYFYRFLKEDKLLESGKLIKQ